MKSGIIKSRIIKSGIIKSGIIKSGIIKSGIIKSGIIKSGIIKSGIIKSGIIKSRMIKSGIIKREMIKTLQDAKMGSMGCFCMSRTQKEIAKDNLFEIGLLLFCNQEDVGMDTGQRGVGCLWMRRKWNFKQSPLPATDKNLGNVLFVLI